MSDALRTQLALLPDYLGNHLLLSASALLIGLALSLPLAVIVTRQRWLQGPVFVIAGAVQTIPSLALLALMVPLLRRIGFLPALLALILYSMLPVIRNTVTGIDEVDDDLIEAGRALGMTDRQLLVRVQLPLAMPVIIAGIRTATVWVVGIATLSTPVGATSLGNYIFSGLQTQNYTAVLVGCAAAAGLALLLDGVIRLAERARVRRSRAAPLVFGLLLLALIGVGLMPLAREARSPGAAAAPVIIGAKTFTEQYILARLIADRLRVSGQSVRTLDSLGSTVAFDALRTGRTDGYVDYSGTIWANYMQRTDNPGRAAITAGVREWLAAEHGIDDVIALGFENAYALAMCRTRAEALGIRSIADLVAHAPTLSLASDYEFFARPEWPSLQLAYGLEFSRRVSMDSSLMYAALQAGEVDVITAFSTDGRIDAFDLIVLDDSRQAFPPYDALLLFAPGDDARHRAIHAALAPLAGRIDNAAMRAANRRVDLDGDDVGQAAASLGLRVWASADDGGDAQQD